MRLDLILPSESPQEDTRAVAELAVAAESRGFGAVWLPDHPLPPRGYDDTYGGVHEALVTIAYLAARTSTLLLGTSVLIAPLREPVLLAKQTATLAALAPGRIMLGVGAGWERSEFDAIGADFGTRGRRTDEILDAVRAMHTTGHGPGGGTLAPRLRHPVPIVVGGTTDAALRRAARIGDVWQAVNRTPEQFTQDRQRLRGLTGRPVQAGARISWQPDGGIAELRARIRAWRQVRPDHLAVKLGDLADSTDRIGYFNRP